MRRQVGVGDADLEAMLQQLPSARVQPQPGLAPAGELVAKRKRKGRKNGKSSKNEPNFNLTAELKRMTGVDLSRIDGIKAMTIMTLISEAGLDRRQRTTKDHFVSS